MSSPGRRLSGLQKDVLALYRTLLRSAGKKPDPNVRKNVINVVKTKFRDDAASVKRNDYQIIEHMLRHGYKQKKILEMPGFTGASMVSKPRIDEPASE